MSKRTNQDQIEREESKTCQVNSKQKLNTSDIPPQILPAKQRKNLEQIANKYYQQASQLTFDNLILKEKIQQLTEQKAILQTKLAFYQRSSGQQIGQESNQLLNKINREQNQLFIPKRNRRLSNKVKKKFVCPLQYCNKLYGTYAALYLHFKNKHPDRSMKLIAHSSNTIKVSGEQEEDSFERELRLLKEQENKNKQCEEKKAKK